MPDSRQQLITGNTNGIGRSGYGMTLDYAIGDSRAAAALSLCHEAGPGTQFGNADIGTADGAALVL